MITDLFGGFFAHIFQADFDLQRVTIHSIILRLGLAVLLGGIIGMERGANRHAAGFRTHILVCLGAALAMLTNQYVCDYISPGSEPTRLGAQVISGIGFLGVGMIVMSGKTKIRGLTTAAGLWASACVGLAIGIGFYAGALLSAFFIYIALAFFYRFEGFFYDRSNITDIYIELASRSHIPDVMNHLDSFGAEILDMTVNRLSTAPDSTTSLSVNLKLPKSTSKAEFIASVGVHDGVLVVEIV